MLLSLLNTLLLVWPTKCLIAIKSLDCLLGLKLRIVVLTLWCLPSLPRTLGALLIGTLISDSLKRSLSLDLHIVELEVS